MAVFQKYINPEHVADMELVLRLIRSDMTTDRIKRACGLIESGAIDWQFVSRLSEKHRVLPIFYVNVKKAGLLPVLPESVQIDLSRRYLNIVGNNLRLCRQLTTILDLFESRGVPVVPFKGPLLAHSLYGDSALRYYQDLDILVPEAGVISARSALLESGFSPSVKHLSGKRLEQVLKHGRECHFKDPSGRIEIDLHWQLCEPLRRDFDYDFCKERLQVIRWHDRNIHSLSPEDTLLHLCVNGAYDIWCDLEKILCVADYIAQHPHLDWLLIQRLANMLHCRRRLFLGLFLAEDVFDAALPREIVQQIKNDRVVEGLAGMVYKKFFRGVSGKSHIEKRVGQLPYYLKIREGFSDKVLYLIRRVFIPTQKDWENRPPDSRFGNFYFLSRPFNLAVELIRALRH